MSNAPESPRTLEDFLLSAYPDLTEDPTSFAETLDQWAPLRPIIEACVRDYNPATRGEWGAYQAGLLRYFHPTTGTAWS